MQIVEGLINRSFQDESGVGVARVVEQAAERFQADAALGWWPMSRIE
jgi:hypothetical protein